MVKLWILLCLETVYHNRFCTNAGNNGDLFREMFPVSDIALSFGQLCKQRKASLSLMVLHPTLKEC